LQYVCAVPLWLTFPDHSDPSGLYNYRNQPARILFALDKLQQALAPLIGYELEHGQPAAEGWAEGRTPEDVRGWSDRAMREMQGWEEEYWRVERDAERRGWGKVSRRPRSQARRR
jgi:uncharacterized protein YdiU (UPF0061 family)